MEKVHGPPGKGRAVDGKLKSNLEWPYTFLYRPYSTDVTHYVISFIFRLLPHYFPLYEWQKSGRFYSDLRNQGSLEFTLLVYQLSAPSSYQAGWV